MAEIEQQLRPDTAEVEAQVDVEGSLATVRARGRRRLAARRLAVGVVSVVAAAALFGTIPSDDGSPVGLDSVDAPDTGRQASATTSIPINHGPAAPPSSAATNVDPESPATEPVTPTSASTTPRERVELEITVGTDEERYEPGELIHVDIDACNTSDREAIEYFADVRVMFRVRFVVTEDERTVALGFHPREGEAVQRWAIGECRHFSMEWNQSEGELGDEGGQMASPGRYTAQVDWFSVDPPPEGSDPGLYDPAIPRRSPAVSAEFLIEAADSGSGSSLLDGP